MSRTDLPCPCNQDRLYQDCCAPYHQHQQVAATPELLMRSRYSAFALEQQEYLVWTWHPDTCPTDLSMEHNPQWVKLEIVRAGIHKYPRHHLGHVHFRATCQDAEGNFQLLEERSRFEKIDGHWLYVDGENSFKPLN